MDNARRRLERLERLGDAAGGVPCEGCGHVPGEPPKDIEVEWPGLDAEGPTEPVDPEYCGSCGTQLVYVVTWANLPGPGGGHS